MVKILIYGIFVLAWISAEIFAAYESWNGSFHWIVVMMSMLMILMISTRKEIFGKQ